MHGSISWYYLADNDDDDDDNDDENDDDYNDDYSCNSFNFQVRTSRFCMKLYDKEHKQDIDVVSSPFHAKISKNNITKLEFKCRNYNFTVRPSFWVLKIKHI